MSKPSFENNVRAPKSSTRLYGSQRRDGAGAVTARLRRGRARALARVHLPVRRPRQDEAVTGGLGARRNAREVSGAGFPRQSRHLASIVVATRAVSYPWYAARSNDPEAGHHDCIRQKQ
jgi:hypothetical protein